MYDETRYVIAIFESDPPLVYGPFPNYNAGAAGAEDIERRWKGIRELVGVYSVPMSMPLQSCD